MHCGKWTTLLFYTDNRKLWINICQKLKINWVYRIIFGECDVELFQAEHQLELFFFFTSAPAQQPHGFKNMSIILPSWLWRTTLNENLSYQHSLQMLSIQARHLLLEILFYHSSFHKFATLPFPSFPSFIYSEFSFSFSFFGIS